VAKAPNATMVFAFSNVTVPLRVLTVQSLKSYGEAWEGSEALFTVTQRNPTSDDKSWILVTAKSITGDHNSTSSISYSTEIQFPEEVRTGNDIRIEIKLVGGSTFKITAMMLCSR
jgi:hypothetical protein